MIERGDPITALWQLWATERDYDLRVEYGLVVQPAVGNGSGYMSWEPLQPIEDQGFPRIVSRALEGIFWLPGHSEEKKRALVAAYALWSEIPGWR